MNDQVYLTGKIVVGLTGNIATGKSAVMRMAAERGALAIDADKIVHEALHSDTAVQEAVAETFGSQVRLADGGIDRTALGEIVFNDAQALSQLEQIIHPLVRSRIVNAIRESSADVVMIEAIKLLEGQLWTLCQEIWVTTCSRERQLQRLHVCRGMEETVAAARIRAQNPVEEKIARAGEVIDTDGLMRDTERQFLQAWSRLLDQ